jgi:hypothetical protein
MIVSLDKVVLLVGHLHHGLIALGRCRKVLVVGIGHRQDPEAAALAVLQTRVVLFPLLGASGLRIHSQDPAVARDQHRYEQALGGTRKLITVTELFAQVEELT